MRDDPAFVTALVARLTRKMEARQPQPWQMSDAPADYLTTLLAAIVGIEIVVRRLTGKWKLSQNKTPADQHGAAHALLTRATTDPAHAIALAMLDNAPGA